MNVLSRTRRAWKISGWRGVLFGILGAGGVRSAGWFLRPLDPDEAPPEQAARVHLRMLKDEDWPGFHALVPSLPREEFRARLARGDRCAAVDVNGRVVAISWLTRHRAYQPYLGIDVTLAPAQAYTFETFVHPDHRGRRLHGCLGAFQRSCAAREGARMAHSLIGFENRPSLLAMRRMGYRRVGVVLSIGVGRRRLHCCIAPGGLRWGRQLRLPPA